MIAVLLKAQIADADGTPEYNNSIPGVFKNAVDWTSRPANEIGRIFAGKPVAVLGASPDGFGTILAQDAWLARYRGACPDAPVGSKAMAYGGHKKEAAAKGGFWDRSALECDVGTPCVHRP